MVLKQLLKKIPFAVFFANKLASVANHITRPRVQKKIKTIKWLGNDYGGFGIDTANIPNNPLVYSFGIGEDISFDLQVIKEFNAEVYAFDPTPKSIKWVENNIHEKSFHFLPYGLSDKNEIVQFHLPKNEEYVSGSIVSHNDVKTEAINVKMKNLETLMQINGHNKIDIIKMDIEGSEFSCMKNVLNTIHKYVGGGYSKYA